MSLTNQCSLQSTNCKITCDMPICYTGDNTSIMQIYDCTVVAYFMVFHAHIPASSGERQIFQSEDGIRVLVDSYQSDAGASADQIHYDVVQ